jgi:hypothetical protein
LGINEPLKKWSINEQHENTDREATDSEYLNKTYKYPTIFSVAVSGMFTMLCLGLLVSVKEYGTIIQNTIGFSVTEQVSFTLKRQGYTVLDHFKSQTQLSYAFLENVDAIIEPYANMTLYIDNQDMYHTYEYVVCSDSDNTCQTGQLGSTLNNGVSFACNPYDTFSVTVDNTYFGSAICMYVRREISSLSSDDLEQTMDAMYTLWSTDEEEGQLIYGSDFHSATYFAEAHHFNAGGRVADHIHEGLGFVTQHIKMSTMFEKSKTYSKTRASSRAPIAIKLHTLNRRKGACLACEHNDRHPACTHTPTLAHPPTSGWSAVAAPSQAQAMAERPRTNQPTPTSTRAQAKTFDSQPPITHSPAAGVCRAASENRAAATILEPPVGRIAEARNENPAARLPHPSQRPIQAA